ncbi:MAG: SGNH/GDSL hydrolase family protein [Terriglobales bacterium]
MRTVLRFLAAMWEENPALLLLAPLLFLQGIYTRAVTVKLPEAAGPRTGSAGRGSAVRILIVGDSAAAGVGVDRQEQAFSGQLIAALQEQSAVRWRLFAKTGATTESALGELKTCPAETFDIAVTNLGVNDVTSGLSVREWLRLQTQLAELLRTRFQVRTVMLTALPPMHKFAALPEPLRWFLGQRAKRFNLALRSFVPTQSKCDLVELRDLTEPGMLATDGFHPSAQTYAAWGRSVAAMILARASQPSL